LRGNSPSARLPKKQFETSEIAEIKKTTNFSSIKNQVRLERDTVAIRIKKTKVKNGGEHHEKKRTTHLAPMENYLFANDKKTQRGLEFQTEAKPEKQRRYNLSS